MKQVVIVGGGILGLASAYYLQRSGLVQVTVLEAGEFAAATTSQAAALLTRAREDEQASLFVAETHHILADLQKNSGQTFAQMSGCWHIVEQPSQAAAELSSLRRYQALAQSMGVHCDWQEVGAIQEALPWLSLGVSAQALAYSDDGHADPYLLAQHYLQAAKQAGAHCFSYSRVSQLRTRPSERGQRVTEVLLVDGRRFPCDELVLAAGPWSSYFARQYGIKLAMAPVRSHYWMTDQQPLVNPHQPMVILPERGLYFRTEQSRLLLGVRDRVNCVADPQQLPNDVHAFVFAEDPQGWEALEEHWQSLLEVCPLLEQAQLAHYISSISSYTPDGKPLLGLDPEWDNFYVVAGCSGAGIAWSGGIGRAMAETIAPETSSVPFSEASGGSYSERSAQLSIAPYALDRFGDIEPFSPAFVLRCAQARHQKKTG